MNGNAVRVVLWGETVGYLTWDSSNWRTTTAVFSFAKDFLDKGIDISPLRLSHHKVSASFCYISSLNSSFGGRRICY